MRYRRPRRPSRRDGRRRHAGVFIRDYLRLPALAGEARATVRFGTDVLRADLRDAEVAAAPPRRAGDGQDWPLPSGKCNCVGTVVALGHEHDQLGGQARGLAEARTMGMVTLFFLFFSIESAFSPSTFSDKTFVRTTGLFLLLLLLSTVLGISIR